MSFLKNLFGRSKEPSAQTRDSSLPRDFASIADELNQPVRSLQETPRRVELCRLALSMVSRNRNPNLWATLNHEMANSLAQNPQGMRADNLEEAITHHRLALEVFAYNTFPEQWAMTLNNLAVVYKDRIHGERADNLEMAIDCCQQALIVRTRAASPEYWATTQINLANAYRERIHGERAENLEQAIDHYQQALKVFTRAAIPERWAVAQNNLAHAYRERIRGDHADNVEQAIHHCQQALEVYTRASDPEMWAMTQNNLGIAYRDRIRGESADNLEKAIHHCQQALEVFTLAAFSERWAMIHHNLGIYYRERIRGERTDNLEQAIHHCQQAMKVYTQTDFPEPWATTHNHLGLAYTDRISGKRTENLEQAIYHYQQALKVLTYTAFPEKWAMTQNNLAMAYASLTHGMRTENLEQAIEHYQQALKIYTHTAFPERWAMTQNNLASVYLDRIHGEHANNVEQAIYHWQQALEVYTRTAFPDMWARTQHNLGIAHATRINGERAENLEQAISHYQQALEVYTRTSFPASYRKTQLSLGKLFFDERRWTEALEAYQHAIDAGNDLLTAAYSEAGRQAEVSETAQPYSRTAYCLLQSNHPGDALVMLERGKTRLLSEALALGDINLKSLSEQQRARLQTVRDALKALEAEIHLSPNSPARRDERTLLDLIHTQRAELNILVDDIRRDHPDFIPLGLVLDDILKIIPINSALVAPLITSQGSAIFIIPHGAKKVTPAHVISLDEFKDDDLNILLLGNDQQPGWLLAYGDYYDTHHLKNWQAAIESLTGRLWQVLIAPIYKQLSALNVKRLLLLPSGGLQLLPLHAAWHMDKDKQARTLLDDYEIIYAPSIYALATACHRAAERQGKRALVAGINTYQELSSLHSAVQEAAAVAHILHAKPLLDSAATEQAIKAGAADASYIHLSCHGSFMWSAPMDSALYLANDEPLRLSEIIGELDLRSARLVTLSACETGISDVSQSPDEYVGLPAGFMQAGAPALVSSLWTVDDRSTALLMERFYRNHIDRKMTYPAALREAQLWLRTATRQELGDYYKTFLRMSADDAFAGFIELNIESDGKPDDRPYANPFYWAAFTFNGASE